MTKKKTAPAKKKSQSTKRKPSSRKKKSSLSPFVNFKNIALFTTLVLTGFILVTFFLPQDQWSYLRNKLLNNSSDHQARLELAEMYLNHRQFLEAETELNKLQKAKLLPHQEQLLAQLWQRKQAEDPQEIEAEIVKWQQILADYPDYRDGWLKLTILYLQLGKDDQATQALKNALELNPNYEITKNLQEALNQ